MPSLLLRRLASSSARRRSSMSRTFASASALARAERSSSVSVRSTTPELLRGGAGGAAGRASGALAGAAGAALATGGSGACGFGGGGPATNPAFAALFDHHLLGPAMAEALAHGARLDARLERQGLGRDTKCLVGRRFRIDHSLVLILFKSCVSAPSVSANSWPHGRLSRRHPPSGIGPGHGCATGTSCSPGPRAAQHVSHLTGPVPNPIVPRSAP